MECWMDVKMFLDEYPHWEVGGLHCPLILQKMFLQATHSRKREAEWMISQGCWHGLPCLDLQADVSAVWSVGLWTSEEEIWDFYHQVYKLRRLPCTLPCRPGQVEALVRDIVSSLKNHLRWKEGKLPGVATHPTWSRTPRREREGTSAEVQLAKSKRGPPEGLGDHHGLRRGGRVTESVHYQGLPWCLHPFSKLGPTEEKVLGVEQKVPQGPTRRQPGSLPSIQPSTIGGWGSRVALGAPIWARAQCGEILPWSGGWRRPFSSWTPSWRAWGMDQMERAGHGHTRLVAGVGNTTGGRWHPEAGPEDMGLLQTSLMDECGTCHPELLSVPTGTPLYPPKISFCCQTQDFPAGKSNGRIP